MWVQEGTVPHHQHCEIPCQWPAGGIGCVRAFFWGGLCFNTLEVLQHGLETLLKWVDPGTATEDML